VLQFDKTISPDLTLPAKTAFYFSEFPGCPDRR
jgi:hypothetical protein